MTPAPLRICFAADRAMAMPLAVALLALHDHHAAADLDVAVLSGDIDAPLWARITRTLPPGANVRLAPLPARLPADIQLPSTFVPACFWRLLIGSAIEAPRVLYLDADVVCRAPLWPLWSTDLEGHALAAVTDATMPWLGSPHAAGETARWRLLDLAPDTPYFNSGVLLLDLDRWRRDGLEARALQLARRPLPYGDQEALLGACGGRWKRLHPRWNLLPEHFDIRQNHAWVVEGERAMQEALAAPALVHYTSSLRPWVFSFRSAHPLAAEWFALLDRTNWQGWRPRPNLARAARNALARLLGHSGRGSF